MGSLQNSAPSIDSATVSAAGRISSAPASLREQSAERRAGDHQSQCRHWGVKRTLHPKRVTAQNNPDEQSTGKALVCLATWRSLGSNSDKHTNVPQGRTGPHRWANSNSAQSASPNTAVQNFALPLTGIKVSLVVLGTGRHRPTLCCQKLELRARKCPAALTWPVNTSSTLYAPVSEAGKSGWLKSRTGLANDAFQTLRPTHSGHATKLSLDAHQSAQTKHGADKRHYLPQHREKAANWLSRRHEAVA